MDAATARNTSVPARTVFEDALGKRHHAILPNGDPIEVLELREEFGTVLFEAAVRERVTALTSFQNTSFARVRSVQRLKQNTAKLLVVSNRVNGTRLSSMLAATKQQLMPLEVSAMLCLLRQLVGGVAMLHEKSMAHGALSTERIVVTERARLVVVDYVLGPALEQLQYSHDRYWQELRVPLPPGTTALDQRTDVMQIGMIALTVMLDRPVDRVEYPEHLEELVQRAWTLTATRSGQAVPAELLTWLRRTLHLGYLPPFESAVDAWTVFETIVGTGDNVASFAALEAFVAEYHRAVTATTATPAASRPVDTLPAPVPASTPTPAAPAEQAPASDHDSEREPDPILGNREKEDAPAASEPVEIAPPIVDNSNRPSRRRWLTAAAAVVLLVGSGALFGRHYWNVVPAAVAEATGTLVVSTNPAGVSVIVDGQPRGVTPLTLELAPGSHELKLAADGEPRIIPLTITAGSTVSHSLEMPKADPRTGQLVVRSEPTGARVTIDNLPVGNTPITIDGLTPGPHTVVLATDVSSVTQEVNIQPGIAANLTVPMSMPQGVPLSGWITIEAPAEVQIYEDERLLGTSHTGRILMTAGRHDVTLVNTALGYHSTRSVTVAPGKVATMKLDWPSGSVALNAQPWAEVWIGGENVGETPIGKISLPIGTHEIVFRHPQLGQQVVRATVNTTATTRVSVDMTKR